jgi:hypothetical protein
MVVGGGGLIFGLIRHMMLMRVRACCVPVRLMAMWIMSSWVPSECQRNVFAKGVILHNEVVGTLKGNNPCNIFIH